VRLDWVSWVGRDGKWTLGNGMWDLGENWVTDFRGACRVDWRRVWRLVKGMVMVMVMDGRLCLNLESAAKCCGCVGLCTSYTRGYVVIMQCRMKVSCVLLLRISSTRAYRFCGQLTLARPCKAFRHLLSPDPIDRLLCTVKSHLGIGSRWKRSSFLNGTCNLLLSYFSLYAIPNM
jgi:hypothetical protein